LPKVKKGRGQSSTASLPTPLLEEVEKIVEELGYWPVNTDFVREPVSRRLLPLRLEVALSHL